MSYNKENLEGIVSKLKEQGINVFSAKRRGLAAPKGTPPEVISYLEEKFAIMAKKPGYQDANKKVGLSPSFLTSAEFAKYISDEQVKSKKILTRIGFFK